LGEGPAAEAAGAVGAADTANFSRLAFPLMLSYRPSNPGLFITGTDTGVGKTVIACALARAWRRGGNRPGVFKPIASGCRREREGLVSDDTEALAHFAHTSSRLEEVTPVRYAAPLAPAVAAEQTGEPVDWGAIDRAWARIDSTHDRLVVEGVGGVLAPLSGRTTVLDLMVAMGYPAVVVTRAGLGTLNHTALTVRALREAGAPLAGLVINGYAADAAEADPSMSSNRVWLEKLTGAKVLAIAPRRPAQEVRPAGGRLPREVLEAMAGVHWDGLAGV